MGEDGVEYGETGKQQEKLMVLGLTQQECFCRMVLLVRVFPAVVEVVVLHHQESLRNKRILLPVAIDSLSW